MLLSGYCGIISELSLFNLGTVLLGGTNTTLLYTMGVMMFFMGVGSLTTESRWFAKISFDHFAAVELALSLICMIAVPLIHLGTAWFPTYSLYFFLIFSPIIGLLIGMEIPIILRLNQELGIELKENSARVMMADYFGCLLAFVCFPFLLYPNFGISFTAYSGAIINLGLASVTLLLFRSKFQNPGLILSGAFILSLGAILLANSLDSITLYADQMLFRDPILHSEQTQYQQLKFTRFDPFLKRQTKIFEPLSLSGNILNDANERFEIKEFHSQIGKDIRFFINGGLQFSTLDEYRYHELMVHPAMGLTTNATRALVLGGGDGLAVREILKYKNIDTVVLVDLDRELTNLFRYSVAELNDFALQDPRVHVVNEDAFLFLRRTNEKFPLIFIDFPDPYNLHVAKLFTRQFYQLVLSTLTLDGTVVVQSTSPLFNTEVFHCIGKTLESAGFSPIPLQVSMKTFENWGFHIANRSLSKIQAHQSLMGFSPAVPTRFLDRNSLISSLYLGKDLQPDSSKIPINDLHRLILTKLYRKGL